MVIREGILIEKRLGEGELCCLWGRKIVYERVWGFWMGEEFL